MGDGRIPQCAWHLVLTFEPGGQITLKHLTQVMELPWGPLPASLHPGAGLPKRMCAPSGRSPAPQPSSPPWLSSLQHLPASPSPSSVPCLHPPAVGLRGHEAHDGPRSRHLFFLTLPAHEPLHLLTFLHHEGRCNRSHVIEGSPATLHRASRPGRPPSYCSARLAWLQQLSPDSPATWLAAAHPPHFPHTPMAPSPTQPLTALSTWSPCRDHLFPACDSSGRGS